MILNYIKLFRLPQWIKNLFIFVPLVFSKHLFDKDYLIASILAFFVFCFITSVVYVINDIVDAESDRLHPKKKKRPIASGEIRTGPAIVAASILFSTAVLLSFKLNLLFISVVGLYFILNVLYSFVLKNIVLLDIFSIAAGFMLRVLAGAFVIDVSISSWLVLTTMFISLFLAVMKRRSELNLVENTEFIATRKVLQYYSRNFADQMATVASAGVIICYALYTVAERTLLIFHTDNLIYTTPFVVFGIFRYMFLVYMNQKGENTIEIMITDPAMIINVLLYILTTTLIIY